MNILTGIISEVRSVAHLSQVNVKLDAVTYVSAILLESPESLPYLRQGEKVKVLFKETETFLSKEKWEGTTVENFLKGTIRKISVGEILTRIEIETSVGSICSVITTSSFQAIRVSVDDFIVAMVNSSEIMLSK